MEARNGFSAEAENLRRREWVIIFFFKKKNTEIWLCRNCVDFVITSAAELAK